MRIDDLELEFNAMDVTKGKLIIGSFEAWNTGLDWLDMIVL